MSWVRDFSTEGDENLTVDLKKETVVFHFDECCSSLNHAQVKELRDMFNVWLSRNDCGKCSGTGYVQPDVAIEVCDCAKSSK